MTDRCPTKSGDYRCLHSANHKGACEAQAPEYAAVPKEQAAPLAALELRVEGLEIAARGNDLVARVERLEAQVKSLQVAAPRGI